MRSAHLNNSKLRVLAFLTLFPLGTAPIVGLFYSLYVHLPVYMSILWRGMLGTAFAIAALGLTGAWLCFLSFDLLVSRSSAS